MEFIIELLKQLIEFVILIRIKGIYKCNCELYV